MVDGASRELVFLFDENMPQRLANALRGLGENAFHVYDAEIGLAHAPDEIVLRYAGQRGWCMVSHDHNILHRAHERAVLRELDMGAFFLNQSLNKSLCSITTAIFRNWSEMKRLASMQPRPFLYLVQATSVRQLRRKSLGSTRDEERQRKRDTS